MSIRLKLASIFFVLTIIPLFVCAFAIREIYANNQQSILYETIEQTVGHSSQEISDSLERMKSVSRSITQDGTFRSAIQRGDTAYVEEFFLDALQRYPVIRAIRYSDVNDQSIFEFGGETMSLSRSGLFFSSQREFVYGIDIEMIINDQDSGVIHFVYDASDFTPSPTRHGHLAFHTQEVFIVESKMGTEFYTVLYPDQAERNLLLEQPLFELTNQVELATNSDGEQVYSYILPLDSTMSVGMIVDKAEFDAMLFESIRWIYVLLLLISIVLLLIWAIVSEHVFIRPLFAFLKTIDHNGNKRVALPEKEGKDEITKLYNAYGSLLNELNETRLLLTKSNTKQASQLSEVQSEAQQYNQDLDNTHSAFINVLEDLEVQKNANALIDAKQTLLIEHIDEAVIFIDPEGEILSSNANARHLLGKEKLQGVLYSKLIRLIKEDGSAIAKEVHPILSVLQGREIKDQSASELIYLKKKGWNKIPVSIKALPLHLREEFLGALIVFKDITHQIQSEQPKKDFVSLVSHQLRTPLSTINWYSELLIDEGFEKLNENQKSYLTQINSATGRMLGLIRSLLNVSRIELGTFAIEPTEFHLSPMIEQVIREIQQQSDHKQVSIVFTQKHSLPKVKLDQQFFHIILDNLLTNAVKYSPASSTVQVNLQQVFAQTTFEHKFIPEDGIVLIVKDQGIGIPQSEQLHIFDKLYRAENARQLDPTGTGLGLYMVKEIVNKIGGLVWFASSEQKGTTFYIYLPKEMKVKKKTGKMLEVV